MAWRTSRLTWAPTRWPVPRRTLRGFSKRPLPSKNRPGAWEYFSSIHSPALLWTVHIAALVIFAMLTAGLFTRLTSIFAFLCAVSYVNRVPGALFGLDDTELMLAAYLMIGPSGAY